MCQLPFFFSKHLTHLFCREQVRVNGFGMFFMAVYPGAFVDLYTEHLTVISPLRQLRIYCAGVWHNSVLVIVGLVLLWSLPYLLVPIYATGQGAVVLKVFKVSRSKQKPLCYSTESWEFEWGLRVCFFVSGLWQDGKTTFFTLYFICHLIVLKTQ